MRPANCWPRRSPRVTMAVDATCDCSGWGSAVLPTIDRFKRCCSMTPTNNSSPNRNSSTESLTRFASGSAPPHWPGRVAPRNGRRRTHETTGFCPSPGPGGRGDDHRFTRTWDAAKCHPKATRRSFADDQADLQPGRQIGRIVRRRRRRRLQIHRFTRRLVGQPKRNRIFSGQCGCPPDDVSTGHEI